jgi:hypothetical protein
VYFVPEANAVVKPQPADGSCLFHALCKGVGDGSEASLLRLQISKHIIDHPDMSVADTTLGDWVRYDSGGCVTAYAARMAGDCWGGGIEMQAMTELKGVNVHVYERCPRGFHRICRFDTKEEGRQTVALLYQGRSHYDLLELTGKQGEWIPQRLGINDRQPAAAGA